MPAGYSKIAAKIERNFVVRQITFKVPELDNAGHQAKVKLIDALGATLYDSGWLAQNSTHKLITSQVFVPLAGTNTVQVEVDNTQSGAEQFTVLIYGE